MKLNICCSFSLGAHVIGLGSFIFAQLFSKAPLLFQGFSNKSFLSESQNLLNCIYNLL